MEDGIDALDEARHQHHLRHRGELNRRLARLFWCVIIAIIVTRVAQRVIAWWSRRSRYRKYHPPRSYGTSGPDFCDRIAAFFEALFLLSFRPPRFGSINVPSPSLGQVSLVTFYTITIILLIVSVNAPKFSSHFVDDIAFRAAWISLTQVPLLYFLATKRGPLNLLAAISYERINWFHRWAGRILLLSATVHMAIMMYSISLYEVIKSMDHGMAIVRYGMGAYGTILWIVLTSILPLRRWSYRLFHTNHVASTAVFLWVLYKHVPTYARNLVKLALCIILFDKCLSWIIFLRTNIRIRRLRTKSRLLVLGFPVELTVPEPAHITLPYGVDVTESTTILKLHSLPISWMPGQHLRLYLPKLGLCEIHPFTPATCCSSSTSSTSPDIKVADVERAQQNQTSSPFQSNDMTLLIRSQAGITRRLSRFYSRWLSSPCPNSTQSHQGLAALIDGPYGVTPSWADYENLILIATSTGVSFTLSIMDYLSRISALAHERLHTRKITFVWITRHLEPRFDATVTKMLTAHTVQLRAASINVSVEVYVTCTESNACEKGGSPGLQTQPARRNYKLPNWPLTIYTGASLDSPIETGNSYETFRSSSIDSESSTLIDEDPLILPELSSAHTPPPLPPRNPRRLLSSFSFAEGTSSTLAFSECGVDTCKCNLIRPKSVPSSSSSHLPHRTYGSRPNISLIVSSAAPRFGTSRTMVAICANQSIMSQTRNLVAQMNFDYAFRRREAGISIFTEGFT
ncbi:hypothetical protein K469DRAFT_752784 [Zopfia rhizophila CBS 207.26]|uniref:FAD-binding FR-type domain-containing protein n=1 Tax=Zopfia rhizophila CBS 207.26 TaxID=1314779 RepID=A0A6A6DPS6_9PEZI|nr:hypothetical protein K469DRAFT_752784 [Zopfia rhizophila CBS 207.26]